MDWLYVLSLAFLIVHITLSSHLTRRNENRRQLAVDQLRRSQQQWNRADNVQPRLQGGQDRNFNSVPVRSRHSPSSSRRNFILQRMISNRRQQQLRAIRRMSDNRFLNSNGFSRHRAADVFQRNMNSHIPINRQQNILRSRLGRNLKNNFNTRNNEHIHSNRNIGSRARLRNGDVFHRQQRRNNLFFTTTPPTLFNGFSSNTADHKNFRNQIRNNFDLTTPHSSINSRLQGLFNVPIMATVPPRAQKQDIMADVDLRNLLRSLLTERTAPTRPSGRQMDRRISNRDKPVIKKQIISIDDILSALLLNGEIVVQKKEPPIIPQISTVPEIVIMPTEPPLPPLPPLLFATMPPTIPPTPSALDRAIQNKILDELGIEIATEVPELPEGIQRSKPKSKETTIIVGENESKSPPKNKKKKPKKKKGNKKKKNQNFGNDTTARPIKIIFSNDSKAQPTQPPAPNINKLGGTVVHNKNNHMLITPLGNFTIDLGNATSGFGIA